MSYSAIDPNRTALLFFDMLNAYFHTGSDDEQAAAKPMLDNCRTVLAHARNARIPVFFARADHRPDGLDSALLYTDSDIRGNPWPNPEERPFKPYLLVHANDWSSSIVPELDPQPTDYYIPKHRWSAFHQTSLELSLRSRGVDTIILCGGATDVGIASTAFAARDLDFNLIIVSDACRSANHDNHNQLITRIFPFMARVRTTQQVAAMITPSPQ